MGAEALGRVGAAVSRPDLQSSGGSTCCAVCTIALGIQAAVATRVARVRVSRVQIHWLGFRNDTTSTVMCLSASGSKRGNWCMEDSVRG